jgi:hypothetical protein
MCRYQALYHNDRIGYAIRCEECARIQVVYGNLVITFERNDFETFHAWIKKIRANQREPALPAVRSIMISSPCQGIQLLLSYNELNDLCVMLDETDTELQSLELLKLFE